MHICVRARVLARERSRREGPRAARELETRRERHVRRRELEQEERVERLLEEPPHPQAVLAVVRVREVAEARLVVVALVLPL